jgi:hypothetical protein
MQDDSMKALISVTTGNKKVDLLNVSANNTGIATTILQSGMPSLSTLQTLNYPHGLAEANRCMGVALAYEARADEARPWLEKAIVYMTH